MTNLDMRAVFENAKNALRKAFPELTSKGIDVAEICKLTQSDYRFEVPLVAGQTLYTFNVLVNQEVFFPTEQRLKQQDSAVIYQLGFFTGLASGDNDNTFMLDTYPVPFKYGANATPMNALYNGAFMKITVNNDVVVPNWDMFKHYNTNQTQQTAAAGAGSPLDQLRGSFDGFYPMEPNVTLIGSKDNVIQVILKPAGVTTVSANSRLICVVRTIVAQNSTVVS